MSERKHFEVTPGRWMFDGGDDGSCLLLGPQNIKAEERIPIGLALLGQPTPEMIERAEKAYVQAFFQSDIVTGDDERLVRVVIDALLNPPSPPLDTSEG